MKKSGLGRKDFKNKQLKRMKRQYRKKMMKNHRIIVQQLVLMALRRNLMS
jgi:hypothetical protein